jgi:hypothetical protein
MPDDEISSILASGFRLLGLQCEENALRDHRRRHSALGRQPPVSRTNLLGSYI